MVGHSVVTWAGWALFLGVWALLRVFVGPARLGDGAGDDGGWSGGGHCGGDDGGCD